MSDFPYIRVMNGQLDCLHDEHRLTREEGLITWCDHIQHFISIGADAMTISAESSVVVPVQPTTGIYALVRIGEEIAPGIAPMEMHFQPELGNARTIDLGLCAESDGRLAIRSVIIDYLKSQVGPYDADHFNNRFTPPRLACPSRTHGINEERARQNIRTVADKFAYFWDVILERACPACVEASSGWDGDNFGIDNSVIVSSTPRWKK